MQAGKYLNIKFNGSFLRSRVSGVSLSWRPKLKGKEGSLILLGFIIVSTILGLIVSWLIGSVIILENNNPNKTAAWVAGLFAFPFLGALLYLILGRHPFKRKRIQTMTLRSRKIQQTARKQFELFKQNEFLLENNMSKRMVRLLLGNAEIPLTINNVAEVLTNGKDKFSSLLSTIKAAKNHIHMEYYIFRDDEIGREILEILFRKRAEGIEIRLVLDGLGCRQLSPKQIGLMREKGIEVAIFFPVHFPYLSSRLNYRNHRKIVIVDGEYGFLGGINVGDEYLSRTMKYGFWRDTHMKIQGDAVHYLQTVFISDWFFLTGRELCDEKYFPALPQLGTQAIQIVASGPDSDRESVSQLFFSALANAEHSIYITTPYFIPDESMIMALKTAARSGLDVRIIVQGKPDHQSTYWAGRSYYEGILESGVRIYEYQKGVLHSKILIIDKLLGIVGSANFDIRSFQLNFEVTALNYDPVFVKRLTDDFWQDIDNSTEILAECFAQRPSGERYKESLARLLSPIL